MKTKAKTQKKGEVVVVVVMMMMMMMKGARKCIHSMEYMLPKQTAKSR